MTCGSQVQGIKFLLMEEEKDVCHQSSRSGLGLGLAHTLINVYILLATSVHLKTDSVGE